MTAASIYSLTEGSHAKVEAAAWARFAAPGDASEFCASWLSILCSQVDRVTGAVVLLEAAEAGSFVPAATWPDASHSVVHLGLAAEATLKERRGIVHPAEGALATHVGYPIEVDGRLHGAVVLDIKPRPDPDVQRVLRQVHWGSAWLLDQFRRQAQHQERERSTRLATANEVLATALQEDEAKACALAVANDLATRLGCERVALGFTRNESCHVAAISHTSSFDERSDFVRQLAEAMDEVLDLEQAMVHPPLQQDAIGGLAHAALSSARGDTGVLSVALADDRVPVGVLTLERTRDRPFGAADLALCEAIGLLLGPVLALKLRQDRPWWQRWLDAGRTGATALFGPRHPGLKLVAATLAAVVVLLAVVDAPYRVTAKVVIEGTVQRSIVAPFQGYVADSAVRAGDKVRQGQVLARLDDRDLRLERTRWASEAEQMQRRYRAAAAAQDRAAMTVAAAQEEQANAQLALVEERLARARLVAPFDGQVVAGDLSQMLGSPVEQGKVLFEIAPLDSYRVILNVDERDIGDVAPGQRGEIVLAGMPFDRLPFTVNQLTPISSAQDGRNLFRVEAHLDAKASVRLRPGMEGVGKVEAGERRLVWIWTHSFVEWLQLTLWRWMY